MHRTAAEFFPALLENCESAAILRLIDSDGVYLKRAYDKVEALWHSQFEEFDDIHLVLPGEAPLFGETNSYFYNPDFRATQFFGYQDFIDAFGAYGFALPGGSLGIRRKPLLLEGMRKAGVIVLDLFPFALNKSTSKNYRDLSASVLFKATSEYFFRPKLAAVLSKATPNALFAFRYNGVRDECSDLVQQELARHKISPPRLVIDSLGRRGGGLYRDQLRAVYQRSRAPHDPTSRF